MKLRPLLVAMTLGSLASLASAQSTGPEIFGVLDVSYALNKADGNGDLNLIASDGNTSSRLGFRGTEDLGNGLKASYWLEGAIAVDTGNGGATSSNNIDSVTGGFNFARRATLGLSGNWGEVRLGRDYTPSFNNLTVAYHPFGVNGVGSSTSLFYPVAAGGTTPRTNVRASNAVSYFLPGNLNGFKGQLMVASGEQLSNAGVTYDSGNYVGGSLGYATGPFSASIAQGTTKYSTGDYVQSNVALSYQYGPAKLMYLYGQNKVGVTTTEANMIGTQYTIGSGEIRAAYTKLTADKVANNANEYAIGYVHNMSKRTAAYVNYAVVDNEGVGTAFTIDGGVKPTSAGGDASGFQIGLRHSF